MSVFPNSLTKYTVSVIGLANVVRGGGVVGTGLVESMANSVSIITDTYGVAANGTHVE
jgi:hypothetical protein